MNAELLRRRLVENLWIYLPAVFACSALAGIYIGQTGSLVLLVALGALGGLTVATARPRLALALGLVAMALPYTWGPDDQVFDIGIVVGLFLLIAYVPILTRFQPSALDLAVLAFAWTQTATAAFQGQVFHLTTWLAPAIVFPYFGFRLLFRAPDARRAFATVIVAIGVIVSFIGIWEGLSGHNPIVAPGTHTYTSSGHYTTTWNQPDHRDGHLRALSTFGHPIAFGMFLLIPLAFALARRGHWNLAAAGVILIALALTWSRGPWVGCVVVIVLLATWNRGRILVAATAIAAAAIFVGPVNQVLAQSGSAATEAGQNGYYRIGLLSNVFHNVSWFGHPFGDLQSAIPTFADVTSLIATTVIQTGILGLIELAAIACLAITALVASRRSGDHDYQAATAALTAQFVGLTTVTLITNYQYFFWVLLAYVATVREVHRLERSQQLAVTSSRGARNDRDVVMRMASY
jgi:hypothetical protein